MVAKERALKLSRKPTPTITGAEVSARIKAAVIDGLTTPQLSDLMQALAWSLGLLQMRAAIETKGIQRAEYDAIIEAVKSQYTKGQNDISEGIMGVKKT
jgi:hypothetical protein